MCEVLAKTNRGRCGSDRSSGVVGHGLDYGLGVRDGADRRDRVGGLDGNCGIGHKRCSDCRSGGERYGGNRRRYADDSADRGNRGGRSSGACCVLHNRRSACSNRARWRVDCAVGVCIWFCGINLSSAVDEAARLAFWKHLARSCGYSGGIFRRTWSGELVVGKTCFDR